MLDSGTHPHDAITNLLWFAYDLSAAPPRFTTACAIIDPPVLKQWHFR